MAQSDAGFIGSNRPFGRFVSGKNSHHWNGECSVSSSTSVRPERGSSETIISVKAGRTSYGFQNPIDYNMAMLVEYAGGSGRPAGHVSFFDSENFGALALVVLTAPIPGSLSPR